MDTSNAYTTSRVSIYNRMRYVGLVLTITLVYFVTGHLGLLLAAVPHGYATLLWPASGIAVAVLLIYGAKAWPAIVLGSFLVNFTSGFELPSPINLQVVVILMGVAFGSAAQALLGAVLVQRSQQRDPGFLQLNNIVKLFILCGPVACLLNPTWGSILFLLGGQIDSSEWAVVWVTWWAGDSLGVMLFLPLALIWLGKPRTVWRKRSWTVALPVVLLICSCLIGFILVSKLEQSKLNLEFAEKGKVVGRALESQITNYLEVLYGLQSLFASTDNVSQEQFRKFVSPALERVPGVYGVSWSLRVDGTVRTGYEEAFHQITKFDHESKRLVPAPERAEHVVVHYLEPREALKEALGFDLHGLDITSEPIRAVAASAARDSGQARATAPVRLVDKPGNQKGVVVFAPVYFANQVPRDMSSRRASLRGQVGIAFRLRDALESAFRGLVTPDLKANFYDVTDTNSSDPLIVYRFDDKSNATVVPPVSANEQVRAPVSYTAIYSVAGRQWRLTLVPDDDYLAKNRQWFSLGSLAIALLITSLLSLFLHVMTGHRILDIQRSRELAKSNADLNREMKQRVQSEQALYTEKECAQVTLRSIGDGVISTDANSCVNFLNTVAESLTGWSTSEAKGRQLSEVFSIINGETREPAENPVFRCLSEGGIIKLANHTVLVSRTGTEFSIEECAAPIRTNQGQIIGVVLVFKDVTVARRLSQQISYQASHDALTGLINRSEFERRLQRVLDTAREYATENSFCYLDLDQFKLVNDTCGHFAGDELLRQIGQLLQRTTRKRDTVARLGGDEFGLLVEHCSIEKAQSIAKNIVEAISNFTFSWDEYSFNIGVSIGLVAVDNSSGNITSVMSCADSACYMAKELGRNRVHLYQDEDEQLTRRHGEMHWAVSLPEALKQDRFCLYYQPIVPISESNNDQKIHCEILLRMEDESGSLVMPGNFLPAANRYQLSSKIDRWVVRHTLRWLQMHRSCLEQLSLCSINLSGLSLSDREFLPFVIEELKTLAIPPQKFCFEITETVAIANLSSATTFINSLRALGCSFALDDFGSGLSSFGYLKNLPVDYLKIDGMFVRDILRDPIDLAMVKSINEIGHIMGKKTIAEFVESEAIYNRLRENGVDFAQGAFIGWPRPINELFPSKGQRCLLRDDGP